MDDDRLHQPCVPVVPPSGARGRRAGFSPEMRALWAKASFRSGPDRSIEGPAGLSNTAVAIVIRRKPNALKTISGALYQRPL